jgi:hypothetical protein
MHRLRKEKRITEPCFRKSKIRFGRWFVEKIKIRLKWLIVLRSINKLNENYIFIRKTYYYKDKNA